jgi:hypothetical protein
MPRKRRWPRWLRRLVRARNAAQRVPRARLRIVSHNAYSAGNPGGIRDHLIDLAEDAERPEVICVQEGWRHDGAIPGYVRVGNAAGDRETGSTFALVRHDVPIVRQRVTRVGPGWVWNGNRRRAREMVDFTVAHDGIRWDVLATHRTPGGPLAGIVGNRDSWAAEDRHVAEWFAVRSRNRPDRPMANVADQNGRAFDLRPRGIGDLARRVGARAAMCGIDGALVRGAKAKARRMKRKYGSDKHYPVVIDLTAPRKD